MTSKSTLFRSGDECREAFPQFYKHPTIEKLATLPRWTFSDEHKMPVSIDGLLHHEKRGASCYRRKDTTTLKNLVDLIPNLRNHALYLENHAADVAILDVESTATQQTRDTLMALPWLYAETSLSGKGLHIVIPYPSSLLERYPNAQRRTLKASDKTWELHFEHWVTFTRATIEPGPTWGTISFEEALEPLFAEQRPIAHYIASVETFDDPENQIADYKILKARAKDMCKNYQKTPEDFAHDMSSYEFGMASSVAFRLLVEMQHRGETLAQITDENGNRPEQATFIIEQAMKEYFAQEGMSREKHDSPRGEMTWLQGSISKALHSHLDRMVERQRQKEEAERQGTETANAPKDAPTSPWLEEDDQSADPTVSYIDQEDQ